MASALALVLQRIGRVQAAASRDLMPPADGDGELVVEDAPVSLGSDPAIVESNGRETRCRQRTHL